jgi:diadenosine tetraphosphatase ApaH/serine/threonine PP2A family protein phosphatase
MRVLVISDIHANLSALDAVLDAAGSFDSVWCMGDVVGYGPDPNECIQRLQQLPNLTCLVGNHDAAVLDQFDVNAFNYEARQATHWTQRMISAENKQFLLSLPERTAVNGVTLAHGSPRQPRWEYLLDVPTAAANFDYFDSDLCFVGHTHVPLYFELDNESGETMGQILQNGDTPEIVNRMILNPGSVGQPRDHDPRASFAIFNPETCQWKQNRVDYDIESVQARMREAGLPIRLVFRLAEGW